MGYDTAELKRAKDGIAPQHYDAEADEYFVLLGRNGAYRVIQCNAVGQPVAAATEATLSAIEATLAGGSLQVVIAGMHSESVVPINVGEEGTLKVTDTAVHSAVESLAVPQIPEYLWLDSDTPPEPGITDRALGVEINTTSHGLVIYYWTGGAWQEVQG